MGLGIITGREIAKNGDGEKNRLILQVQFTADDVRPVEFVAQAGEDTNPADGCRVMVLEADKSYKIVVAVTDDLLPECEPGEKEVYSTDNPATVKLARMKLNKDGEIELNGNVDNGVGFEQLKIGFDQFLTDFNNFVTAYNTHVHITTATVGATPTPGLIAATTSTGTSSSASIDDSKKETVKLP